MKFGQILYTTDCFKKSNAYLKYLALFGKYLDKDSSKNSIRNKVLILVRSLTVRIKAGKA